MNIYGVCFDEGIDKTSYLRFNGLGIGHKGMERAVTLRILKCDSSFRLSIQKPVNKMRK